MVESYYLIIGRKRNYNIKPPESGVDFEKNRLAINHL